MTTHLEGHSVRDPRSLHPKVQVQLDHAAEEVTRELGNVEYETVHKAVMDAYERIAAAAKFPNFLPILAARAARQSILGMPHPR